MTREFTHAEPSKLAPSGVVPRHPIGAPNTPNNGNLTCPGVRNVTVWISVLASVQRMLSFVWIQNSFGKKARAWLPKSRLCAPTQACHSFDWRVPLAATASRVAGVTAPARGECCRRAFDTPQCLGV